MNVDRTIQEDWAENPEVMQACLHIWYALSNREFQLDHYTFEELIKVAGTHEESLVSQALLYLSTPKLKVLKTCLMYEFDGSLFELPDEEVAHYSKGEAVVHPEFGEPMHESQILICFTSGARLQSGGAE